MSTTSFQEPIMLRRDVNAIAIPAGTKFQLAEGQEVRVIQELGGNFTVLADGMPARIDGKDADALGLEAPLPAKPGPESPSAEVNEDQIWEQMRHCYDPEIPVNIVDLGLIYSCEVKPGESGGRRVDVKMTLTAPGCGMGQVLADDVRSRIVGLPGVAEANVEIVWEPQWNQSMMSDAARLQLGLM